MIAFDAAKNSFQAQERPRVDPDAIADREEGAGLMFDSGGGQALNRQNFGFVDGSRNVIKTDDLDDPGGLQDGQTILGVEPAKEVSREQRSVEFLDAVGPALAQLVKGQKTLIALAGQLVGHARFLPGTDLESEPWKRGLVRQVHAIRVVFGEHFGSKTGCCHATATRATFALWYNYRMTLHDTCHDSIRPPKCYIYVPNGLKCGNSPDYRKVRMIRTREQ